MFPLGPFGPFARLCKVHYLRIADLGADRSERRLSAIMAFLNMNSPTPNISQLWRNTHRDVSGVEAESCRDGGYGGYAGHHVSFGI